MQKQTKKIVLIGESQTGKSSYVKLLLTGQYQIEYIPTMGVEVYPIVYECLTFNVWDTSGVEKFGGLRDGYYIQANSFLVFADTEKNTNKWLREIFYGGLTDPNIPLVLIWPKSDLQEVPAWLKELADKRNFSLVSISTKNETNLYTPLAFLSKML